MVHQAKDGSLAVYALLFEADTQVKEDPFDKWNLDTKKDVKQPFPIDLVTPLHVYHYVGSLTTPDCSEGVQWFVNPDALKIKKDTVNKLATMINEGH